MKWITDDNGNMSSVEYWGSEEKAQEALVTLKDCRDCVNCSDCYGCSDCSDLMGYGGKIKPSSFVPQIPDIHRKVYEAVTAKPDALEMDTWHTCDTTHCRAGWVVVLAGDEGKALEMFHGPLLAAQLIYRESGYKINPARFFDSNEDAVADIKRLAEGQ